MSSGYEFYIKKYNQSNECNNYQIDVKFYQSDVFETLFKDYANNTEYYGQGCVF